MKFKGIQSQLFWTFSVLVLVVGLFHARLNYLFISVAQDIVADFMLVDEGEWLIKQGVTADNLRRVDFTLYTQKQALPEIAQAQPGYGIDTQTFERDDETFYLREFKAAGQPFWLVLHVSEVLPLFQFSRIFTIFMLAVTLATIALATLSTWYLASRIARPIQSLTADVAAARQAQPVTISGTQREDEIGQLACAFDTTLGELNQALQREQNFTRDVSHELRTPITLIRNTMILKNGAAMSQADDELITRSVDDLQQTVETLLALARKENLSFVSENATAIIERCIITLHQVHPDMTMEIDADLPGKLLVTGNAYLIHLLCQNLINNSYYHGDRSALTIRWQAGALVFANPLKARNESASDYQGLGHGQYLVERIAHTMGWQVTFSASDSEYQVLITPTLA